MTLGNAPGDCNIMDNGAPGKDRTMNQKQDLFGDKVVLVTGGTGSFGKQFVATMLREHAPRKLIIFSRDELKQFDMRGQFDEQRYPCMRYFIGDVRDRDRLYRAMDGV